MCEGVSWIEEACVGELTSFKSVRLLGLEFRWAPARCEHRRPHRRRAHLPVPIAFLIGRTCTAAGLCMDAQLSIHKHSHNLGGF